MGAASHQGSLLVVNFDLEPECPDAELRATLQWIAASELGIPTIYFKKSQENRIEKVSCSRVEVDEACLLLVEGNSNCPVSPLEFEVCVPDFSFETYDQLVTMRK